MIDTIETLRETYPYLYEIEMRVREVKRRSGFGSVITTLTIRNSRVEVSEIGEFSTRVHREVSSKNVDNSI